jgi:hypothetical protein
MHTPEEDEELQSLIEDISPDVFLSLERSNFFSDLESRIFPDRTVASNTCDSSYLISIELLTALGHDEEAQEEVFAVMQVKGGFCDCEILLNAAPESAARASYWKSRAENLKVE